MSDSYSALGTGTTLQFGYDAFLRRSALTNTLLNTRYSYGYDAAGRLDALNDGTNYVSYTYTANSPLVSTVSFKQNTTLRLSTAYTHDTLNRLTSIISTPQAASELVIRSAYFYNAANQRERERIEAADLSQWHYSYDKLGQVESGRRVWNDLTPVAGEQFEYVHDTIGNRRSTKAGGDGSGSPLQSANYSVNDLNQIITRDVPAAVDIIGAATATNIVTVNGNPASRHGEFYHHALAVNNAGGPVWQGVTNALYETNVSVIGHVLVPPATQSLQYDVDGNLTNDLVWHYQWDGENRLVQVSNTTSVVSSGRKKLNFDYDHAGRRYRKVVSTWNGDWIPAETNYFFYDDWLLVGETGQTNKSYLWGIDLSGSPSWSGGAAGVGGLVATVHGQTGYFPAYDGNGNVVGLIDAESGYTSATYELASRARH